ncbi:MAG: hypothetical protein ABIN97_14400 [Ginsengibacter sp.]
MATSKDQNNENEFPGYPHYPAKEDIMNSGNNERVDLDVEKLSRSKTLSGSPDKSVTPPQAENTEPILADIDDDVEIEGNDDADITAEDLIALGQDDANFGKVERLSDEDLDVPGAEEDDANEEIGEEDEENNYYSLGGDAHENLEEDKAGENL